MPSHTSQSKKTFALTRIAFLFALTCLSILAWQVKAPFVSGETTPAAAIEAARKQVRTHNSYSFDSSIIQITIPETTFENLGNTSREERLFLTGNTNLSEQSMAMMLRSDAWENGGSVLIPDSGVEIVMADGQTRARQANGEWETLEGFTDGFAPQGDFMSFLVASADVTAHPLESINGIEFTRYTFNVDGLAFANYVREQMQTAMRERNELPQGAVLQASPTYAEMTGDGELWIATNGLPLRQILNLHFPPQNNERVVAHIKTDFSNYGEPTAAAGFIADTDDVQDFMEATIPPLTMVMSSLLFVAALYLFRRSHRLESGIAWLLISSMVLGPLLQAYVPTGTAHAQGEDSAETNEVDEQQEHAEAIRKLITETPFDPTIDPLSENAPNVLDAPYKLAEDGTPLTIADGIALENDRAGAGDTDGDGLSDSAEIELGTDPFDMDGDTDNDGLDDFQEVSLGTDPRDPDSDGDTLTDKEEVEGYFGWYLDPTEADSNKDGLSDAQELGPDANDDGQPDSLFDRDNDGVPDIFDDDNDGDGVPDDIDLAPIHRLGGTTPFSDTRPFELAIDNIMPGRVASVDFQLRPVEASHLWYAYNVLDWPLDRKGQVQDWDGKTFATANTEDAITPPEEQNHGDMRLTPMLEIRIPDNGNPSVPSVAALDAYSATLATAAATINDLTSDGTPDGTLIGKVIYLPLSLVSNPDTGERVAFSASLPLLSAESWGVDYEIRVVWAVQMLQDSCEKTFDTNKNLCEIYDRQNVPMPIHTYDEAFEITGINVREDISAKTSIIYENPQTDPDVEDDEALWALTNALDESFLSGLPISDTVPVTITVAEIARRFDHRSNSGVSTTERWGIPNYLVVEAGSDLEYDNLEEAVKTLTMERTNEVLSNTFSSVWLNSPLMPMLMYATENTYRGVSMDELATGGPHTSFIGDRLHINFAPSGTPQEPTKTNSLSWAAYCGSNNGGTVEWIDCDTDVYWNELDRRHRAEIDAMTPDPEVADGQSTLMKLYWTGLRRGVQSVVYSAGRPQNAGTQGFITDATLQSSLAAGAAALGAEIASKFQHKEDIMRTIGRVWHKKVFQKNRVTATSTLKSVWSKISVLWSTDVGVSKWARAKSALIIVALVGTIVVAAAVAKFWPNHPATKMATSLLIVAVQVAMGAIMPIMSIVRWSTTLMTTAAQAGQTLSRLAALKQVMNGSSGLIANTKLANMIGAALVLVVAWSFFIASIVNNGVEFLSAEFNRGLGYMIATSLVIYALAAIASNPYGLVATIILTLVDAVLLTICAIEGTDFGDCKTGTGEITKFVAKQVYSYDVMIDLQADNLRTFGVPTLDLHDKSVGMEANTSFTLTLPVTTTAKHKEPEPEDWKIALYQWFFSESNFKSGTFIYAMRDALGNSNPSLNADRDDNPGAWQGVYSYDDYLLAPLYTGYQTAMPTISEIRRPEGINQAFDYNFNSAYAIPAYECWLVPNPKALLLPIPLCYIRTKEGSNSSYTKGPIRDLFPPTLDEFMALTATGQGGYRLAWDDRFPTIYDADADGLVTSELVSGGDPNDALWDSDYDGVSDKVELEQRNNGVGFSPIICDSDADGLTDAQELRLGTHPLRKDTDNDGLKDNEEVRHAVYQCHDDKPPTRTGSFAGGMQYRITPFGESLTATVPSAETVIVWVSSDPTERDIDNDGIPDSTEFLFNQQGKRDDNGLPFNPNVANEPPLKLFTELDSSGGFAAPGQTLAYSATVTADTDFQAGVLEVQLPPTLGDGIPETYALPAFTANTSSTINTLYTVNPLASSGPVTVTSSASARPALVGGIPEWAWENPQVVSINSSLDTRGVNSSWIDPSATSSYMFSTLIDSGADADGDRRGEIRTINVPDGTSNTITPSVNYSRSEAAPDIACNDDGRCFSVWDERNKCSTLEFKSLYVGEDEEGSGHYGIEPQITVEQSSSVDAPQGTWSYAWRWSWTYAVDQMREGTDWPLTYSGGSGTPTHFYCQGQNDPGPFIKVYEDDGPDPGDKQGTFYRVTPDIQDEVEWDIGGPHALKLTFDVTSVQRNRVKGRFIDENGDPLSPTAFTALDIFDVGDNNTFRADLFPAVATNGDNFLVAWNYKVVTGLTLDLVNFDWDVEMQSYVKTLLVDASGSAIGSTQTLLPGGFSTYSYDDPTLNAPDLRQSIFGQTEPDVIPQVVWAGDRYVVAYTSKDGATYKIESQEISDTTGAIISGSFEEITDDVQALQASRLRRPQVAYNPTTNRLAYSFTRATDNYLTVKLIDVSGATSPTTPFVYNTDGIYPDSPSIAYYRPTEGWMVSWQKLSTYSFGLTPNGVGVTDYAALNPNGTLLMHGSDTPEMDNLYGASRPLSCAAPTSEPIAIYDFEELPGATTFASDIGGLAAVICDGNDCPVAGVSSAAELVDPYSDRAVYFDGNGDRVYYSSSSIGRIDGDFSVAFWMKADGSATGNSYSSGHRLFSTWGNETGISLGAGDTLYMGNDSGSIIGGYDAGDGDWHHVVLTRNADNGILVMYIDGSLTNAGVFTSGDIFQNGFHIGGYPSSNTFKGWIDDFRMYETVLSADTVGNLFNRTQRTVCIVSGPASNGAETYQIGLERQDPRGNAQPVEQHTYANLTIDADAPVSTLEAITETARSISSPPRYVKVSPGGMTTQIIGGSSDDNGGSGVSHVLVTVNGGTPVLANGTANWVYALAVAEGVNNVAVAATDAVGNVESLGATITFIGDATAPAVQWDPLPSNLNPPRDSDGNYLIALSGLVTDAQSGVQGRFVDLKLTAADGTDYGWQKSFTGIDTTDTEVYYYHEYLIPGDFGDPTGTYTMSVSVIDGVGNSAEYKTTFSLTLPDFEVRVSDEDAALRVVTDTSTIINGVVSSTQTISNVEATFVPIEQLAVLSGTVVSLDLANPDNDAWSEDTTDSGNDASCTRCPFTPASRSSHTGTYFDGGSKLVIPHNDSISFADGESFTVQAWIKTDKTGDAIWSKYENQTGHVSGIELWIQGDGTLKLRKNNDNILTSNNTPVNDNVWHQVTVTIDRVNAIARIYVDGNQVAEKTSLSNTFQNIGPLVVGGHITYDNFLAFDGYIEEFTVWQRALAADEVAATMALHDPTWQAANVVPRAGRSGGMNSAEWSLPVPADTEGFHRIDVRITDDSGNQYRASSDWQTIIDTLAPRVTINEAFATGNTYDSTGSGNEVYDIQYSITAKDLHLDEASFNSVCNATTAGDRGYEANETSWAQNLFPDVTWRDSLGFGCHIWSTQANPTINATVCDIYGNCSNEATFVDTSGVPTGQTAPIIVSPASDQVVDGSGLRRSVGRNGQATVSMDIHIIAEHPTAMKTLEVYYNGVNLVKTINFSQASNTTYYNQVVSIDLPGENNYDLSIVKTNWDNSSENSPPMNFTLDTELPTGTINTDDLTEEDALVVGSGMMRFHGIVTETMEMATVQLSVDGGPFEDVTLNNDGTWHGAVYVGEDVFEQALNVTVRFIDKADAVGTVSETIYVDIEEPSVEVPTSVSMSHTMSQQVMSLWLVLLWAIALAVLTWWFRPVLSLLNRPKRPRK